MDLLSIAEGGLVIKVLPLFGQPTDIRHGGRNKGMNSDLREMSHLTRKGLHYMKVPTFVNL